MNATATPTTKAERLAHIETLKKAANDAYDRYDRAERQHVGAGDECRQLYREWQQAQDAWQEARYMEDLRAWEFAKLLGTSGYMIEPKRSSYY